MITMAELQSSSNMHLAKESVSTTFNPKTGGFHFSLDTTTLIACLVAIIVVLGLVFANYSLLKEKSYPDLYISKLNPDLYGNL